MTEKEFAELKKAVGIKDEKLDLKRLRGVELRKILEGIIVSSRSRNYG